MALQAALWMHTGHYRHRHRHRRRLSSPPLLLVACLAVLVLPPPLAASTSTVVTHLPGFDGPLPFYLETGYVEIEEETGAELFYFVESERSPHTDPFILYLSGGPMCSAICGFALQLAVKVQFECNREAKMLPTLLKCFPRLETLHIMPTPSETPDNPNDLRTFWEHLGPCECLESHLETVMLYGSLAEGNGGGFIRYMVREGKALKTIALVCCDEKASGSRQSAVGGSGDIAFCPATPRWSFQAAIDLSLGDPFGVLMA